VSADHDDLGGTRTPFEDALDIAHRQLGQLEGLPPGGVAACRQLPRDVLRRAFEGFVVPQVPLADGAG
jgi:hypothetical protein